MNNFKDGGFKRGGKDFGGRPKFGGGTPSRGRKPVSKFGGDRGGRPQGPVELFTATCSSCKKSCEVPFRPSVGKPVFCSACFGVKNSDDSRSGDRGEFRPRNDVRSERPSYAKPQREYQPAYSEVPRMQKDAGLEEVKQQLKTIELRLNRILDLMNPPVVKAKVVLSADDSTPTESDADILPKKVRKPKTVKAKKVVKKAAKKGKKK